MKDDLKTMKKRFRGIRPFLVRLLTLTLAVCMLPLLALSTHMLNAQKAQLRESEQMQLEAVAQNVAGQWDSYLMAVEEIQSEHQLNAALKTGTISSSISAEMEAIEALSNLQTGQSYLYENGIIRLGEEAEVYTNSYKHQLKYYAPQKLGMSEADFLTLLEGVEKATFLPYNEQQQTMVYLYPESRVIRGVRRVGLYIFTASSLLNSLDTLLRGGYTLDRVEDMNGTLVYQGKDPLARAEWQNGDALQTDSGLFFRTRCTSVRGYTFYLRKSETALSERVSGYVHTVTVLIFIVAIVTALCAVAAVSFNYRPIRQAMQRIGQEGARHGGNEIAAIYNAYASQKEKREQLEIKSETYRTMMTDRIYKCLLGGRFLTNEEYELLHWQEMLYCVAVCDLVDSGVLEEAQRRSLQEAHIRTVSMRMDGVAAFICFLPREERAEQLQAVRQIHAVVDNDDAVLGVSRVYSTLASFRTAYVESMLAMQSGAGGGVLFAQDAPPQSLPLFYETSFDTLQLINLFRKGDEKAVSRVMRMLDSIDLSEGEESARQYAFFRLLEYLRGSMQKAGITVEENRFAIIASLNSVTQRHDALEALVREVIDSRCQALALEKDTLERDMIAYVEQHYSQSDFGLEMFADRFHMTPSAASRVFKDLMGVNFRKYINSRRITQAKLLLEATSEGIAEIAEKTGFSSASYFGQVFKASEGIGPAAYREEHAARAYRETGSRE